MNDSGLVETEMREFSKEEIFYVYLLFRLDKPKGEYRYGDLVFDYEPFYVGKGHKGQRDRMFTHFNPTLRDFGVNGYKKNIIVKLLKEGYVKEDIAQIYVQNINEETAFEIEKELILKIGRADEGRRGIREGRVVGPLTNRTDGGDGHVGGIVSEENRQKLRERMKTFKHTPESKAKIAENNRIRKLSPETGRRISAALKGRKLSEREAKIKREILDNNLKMNGPPASLYNYKIYKSGVLVYEGDKLQSCMDIIGCSRSSFFARATHGRELHGFRVERTRKQKDVRG